MKSPLPYRYLKSKNWRQAKLTELLVLIYHVYKGAEEDEVGFEDAQLTKEGLVRKLNKKVWIEPSALESALWSCNLMNERGLWWHPQGLSFDEFVKQICGKDSFHRVYNLIEEKEDER